ncbi:inactive pancreatic lipase-related protein 1 [Microcaecilia unicolor]|uniref:Triacylglycerol lipase n=1 Tax=Microcaecilia unicolor TaxID=1415580 RepID=A0A6P7Y6K5_9AMPH|nr:inactive pancreatic lipase-related protein 1-like [Microcaecilia unicolor]
MFKIWTVIPFLLGIVRGNEVCYDEPYGCFKDEDPWGGTPQRIIPALPWSPEKINTRFFLFTRDTMAKYQEITAKDPSTITASSFRQDKAIHMIIHGLTDRAEGNWVTDMCQKMLSVEDVNCIGVDWRNGCSNILEYVQAANNFRVVGVEVARIIRVFKENFEVPLSNVHLIGHSLGAHVAGEAGKRMPGLARITALDPAGPYFEDTPPEVRLDISDAQMVDVIHSNAKFLLGAGIRDSIGHVDFFPNGGKRMPGCGINLLEPITDLLACSHLRVIEYYIDSITSRDGFVGYPCVNYQSFNDGNCFPCPDGGCPMMGHYANTYGGITSETQVFYLNTGSAAPYSRWRCKISVKLPRSDLSLQILVALSTANGNTQEYGIKKKDNSYFSIIDAEVKCEDTLKVTFRWKRTLISLFQRVPNTFGAESVTVQSGQDGRESTFCSNQNVKENDLQTLTPC